MPPTNEHVKLSLKRTGKDYKELHEWMNEEYARGERSKHDILNIPRFLPIIKEKFGENSIQEYLYHIKEDYEKSKAYKIVKILLKLRFW